MPRAYASAVTLGITSNEDEEVILALYGPRGGTRSTEGLAPDQALKLSGELRVAAFELLDREEPRHIGLTHADVVMIRNALEVIDPDGDEARQRRETLGAIFDELAMTLPQSQEFTLTVGEP